MESCSGIYQYSCQQEEGNGRGAKRCPYVLSLQEDHKQVEHTDMALTDSSLGLWCAPVHRRETFPNRITGINFI